MNQIFTQILVTIVGGCILAWLGMNNSKTTIRIQAGHKVSKIWKILIVIGWLMFWAGAIYGLSWASVKGFSDPKTAIGISLFVSGIGIWSIGKLGAWWNN